MLETSSSGKSADRARWPRFLLAAAALAAVTPLILGLRHGFYRDDFTWLEHACRPGSSLLNSLVPWKEYELRSLGQALFYIEYRLFGFSSLGFNITSLLLCLAVGALVVRLATLAGASRRLSLASGVLFVAGVGHFGRPVSWACAQVVQLGSLFALSAAVVFLARHGDQKDRRAGGFPFLSYLLLGAGLATHEIVFLAPVGLALLAYAVGHPHRRWMAILGVCISIGYQVATLSMHGRHPVAATSIPVLLRNAAQYPAVYLLPLQSPNAIGRMIGGGAPSATLRAAANGMAMILGVLVLVALALYARKAGARMRGIIGFGFLLLIPAFALPMPQDWIEVRYLYPVSTFWSPAICSGLALVSARLSRRTSFLFKAAVALWFLGILAGSSYIQMRAREDAQDPTMEVRWVQLEEILGRPIPH